MAEARAIGPADHVQAPHRGLRLPLPPTVLAGFGVAVVAVLLIGLFTYRSLQHRESTAGLVSRTVGAMENLQKLLSGIKDAETGQRGYLITGSERYLEPYLNTKAGLANDFARLRAQLAGNGAQLERLAQTERLMAQKLLELDETIALKRRGDAAGALAIVLTDRGKSAMDNIRSGIGAMVADEQRTLERRQAEWQDAVLTSTMVSGGGAALLLLLIAAAAWMSARDYRARETQVWLRAGQAGLSLRLQGEQRLETLGTTVLDFLSRYLDAQVGALYIAEPDGRFRRVAAFALPDGGGAALLQPGDGLLGQAATCRSARRSAAATRPN